MSFALLRLFIENEGGYSHIGSALTITTTKPKTIRGLPKLAILRADAHFPGGKGHGMPVLLSQIGSISSNRFPIAKKKNLGPFSV